MKTLVRRIEDVESAAQSIGIGDDDELSQLSDAERRARIEEFLPRFLEEINTEGLSADPERRRCQERILELLQIGEARRKAAMESNPL